MGCLLMREHKQKKIQLSFSKVCICLRESFLLRECVNTEFDWEIKLGFEKVSVSKEVVCHSQGFHPLQQKF